MIGNIDLDYRPRKNRLGQLLLSVGVATATLSVLAYANLAARAERWEQASSRAALHHATAAVPHGGEQRKRLQHQVIIANQVISSLSLPWDQLFQGIEDSAIDKIALLSVQPQPQQGLITLSGEAGTYADVLRYMERIDSSAAFTRARLLSHRIKDDSPNQPVMFTIAATWRIAP